MLRPTIQRDLVWLLRLEFSQQHLRLMPLLSREYLIRLRRGDAQWPSHRFDLLRVHERRVRDVADFNFIGPRPSQVPHDVLRAEAVAYRGDLLSPEVLAHGLQARLDDGVDGGGLVDVLVEPALEVETRGSVHPDGVPEEDVWHEDGVAVGGELVGEELDVEVRVPDHVGDAVR